MSEQRLGNWARRGQVPSKEVFTVASVLGVRADWIMTGKEPMLDRAEESAAAYKEREDELTFVGTMDVWDSDTPLDDDEVELPLFREVELSAGAGQTQVIESQGAKLRFAKSTLKRAGVMPENAACAFVSGNSMEPALPHGSTVGVDTGDREIRDGKIFAFDHGGMLRIKYLHRRPGGALRVISMNADEHPPEEIPAEEVQSSVRIIGRVFWWSVIV